MRDLNVTIVQTDLAWQNIEANLAMLDRKLDGWQGSTDLVILPEMFSTGFSMEAERLAESMDGSAVTWLRAKAKLLKADVTGSLIICDGKNYYNRLVWAKPDGSLSSYDKRHLFAFVGEDKVYTSGTDLLTVELRGWRIRPFICYDLRFPIWCRNLDNVYDLAIFTANWPKRRAAHWKALLLARAIENQAFVIGVNRVGTDGNGLDYSGDSMAVDPQGKILFHEEQRECVIDVTFSRDQIAEYRKTFPFWKDVDRIRC
jgi:predicted amidohydrolase